MENKDYDFGISAKDILRVSIKIIFIVLFLGAFIGFFGYMGGWFSEAGNVAQTEFGAKASLKKYEWFKDAATQLEKKLADIKIYSEKIKTLENSYENVPRKDWDRVDKQQTSQWQSELAGIKSSYNQLAAEYNAASNKFNWSLYKTEIRTEFKEYTE